MKVLSKNDAIELKKTGKLDKSVNVYAKSRLEEKEDINQEDFQEKILLNMAEIISKGLTQKDNFDNIITTITSSLTSVSDKNIEVLDIKLTDLIKSIQKIKFPEPKQVNELIVDDIKHDSYGRMTGFKAKAIRG
jgi:hypothetical protein